MQVGDLVKSNSGTKHHGKAGIIIGEEPRWPNEPREDAILFEVLYPSGIRVKWDDRNLEVINESR